MVGASLKPCCRKKTLYQAINLQKYGPSMQTLASVLDRVLKALTSVCRNGTSDLSLGRVGHQCGLKIGYLEDLFVRENSNRRVLLAVDFLSQKKSLLRFA